MGMIADDSGEWVRADEGAAEVVGEGRAIQPLLPVANTDVARAPLFPKPSASQAGAEPLENRKHERFAQLVAYEGHTFTYAYQEVFGGKLDSARANAARLKRTHPEVAARIAFLDAEIKAESMLHRGATFARTVNDVSSVLSSMLKQKSDPKASAVALKAAEILLKATGNDAPATVTTVEETREEVGAGGAGGADAALAGIRAVLSKVRRTTRTEAAT